MPYLVGDLPPGRHSSVSEYDKARQMARENPGQWVAVEIDPDRRTSGVGTYFKAQGFEVRTYNRVLHIRLPLKGHNDATV